MLRIALFGASGMVGQRIAREALKRGHSITAIVRASTYLTISHPRLEVAVADASVPADVAEIVQGYDVVVSALGPSASAPASTFVDLTRSLIEGVGRSGVPRLIAVGGAGSLEVKPGVQLMDTPDFPEDLQAIARAHREALAYYRPVNAFDWTVISPAANIEPGQCTGHYRTATDQLVTNAQGESNISVEDFAIAVLDELEEPHHNRQRFTVGY
ncbi:NAD(P)-dependent oxidoreductase [Ktedonospora formicarum]|uniref:3-beta hydroxysteroid dehydrogenase n=1 Tax=Ktedonospora formicarum TaxID=2778364 RepID=A0A8J3I0X7_9CHLR|nr:NAD(P)-dependent oxidoreductase [Ktedonospora formicarum]GHO47972.1 3-beta hydroxysteroid dehydrogenase [Ktedonospora formicarum]